jgi:hypothetical protein
LCELALLLLHLLLLLLLLLCVQWLINTAESLLEGDTSWSDLLSELLQDLHNANDVTGEGPMRGGGGGALIGACPGTAAIYFIFAGLQMLVPISWRSHACFPSAEPQHMSCFLFLLLLLLLLERTMVLCGLSTRLLMTRVRGLRWVRQQHSWSGMDWW